MARKLFCALLWFYFIILLKRGVVSKEIGNNKKELIGSHDNLKNFTVVVNDLETAAGHHGGWGGWGHGGWGGWGGGHNNHGHHHGNKGHHNSG